MTLVRVEELAKEIEAQFQGPEGLAVSQFIKPGRAAKPEAKKGKGPLRRKKRHASSLAAHPLSSSTYVHSVCGCCWLGLCSRCSDRNEPTVKQDGSGIPRRPEEGYAAQQVGCRSPPWCRWSSALQLDD